MKALLDGLKALGPARLAAMAAVGLGVMVMLGILAMRGGQPRYALLYGDLDMRESAQIVDSLTRQHIGYQVVGNGGQIMVPIEDVGRARLMLAKDGLPSGGSVGYELFDRGDSLTTSQFQQQMNQTRALEGELARTIRTIDGVRAARVHLVLPHREPFQRERQDAQASVMLTMNGANRLDNEAVQAILNLVAAAVPGLRPQGISIVDNRGTMLARAGEPLGGSAASQGAEEMRRQTEIRLARAVEDMLEQSVGPGRVRAEAAVEMDYERINETQEKYDPDGKVERSEQSVNSTSKTTEKEANTSVQNNLPNPDAGNNQTGTQESKQEATTNFEIGRTVRTLVREQPMIKRLSIAVMVDGTDAPGPDGKPVWKPRPPEELARLTALVQSAIGYDAKRGDHVEVASLRFAGTDDGGAPEPAGLFGLHLERADIVRLAETAMIGILALLALLLVLRPMVNRLTLTAATAGGGIAALAGALPDGFTGAIAVGGPAGALAGPAAAALAGPGGVPLLEDESMVNMANIEGQMRASAIRKVSELAERHPEETVNIMRGWLAEGTG
jgi:flagellar M-ring protein FliF